VKIALDWPAAGSFERSGGGEPDFKYFY